ncbi:hypothetical protein BHE74_00041192 [Ensete ventricosum]|nr:hypothetical protein BHE74_00041192 [Ensete ventricosum]
MRVTSASSLAPIRPVVISMRAGVGLATINKIRGSNDGPRTLSFLMQESKANRRERCKGKDDNKSNGSSKKVEGNSGMANLVKEEEKNEKIIRGLLKLPANRRCINCNSLVRLFTFPDLDTHKTCRKVDSLAVILSSSNIDRLRDFIKNVYVYRRYTGESVGDRPQKMKVRNQGIYTCFVFVLFQDKRDNYNENQKAESYRSGLRSPSYEDRYSPSYGGRNSDRIFIYNYGERSPGYDQGKHKRSPAYFEVVDDRRRDNKVGNVRQNRSLEAPGLLDAPKPKGKSPDHQKNVDKSSDPVVNQAKDTLGDDVPPLQIGKTAISKETMVPDGTTQVEDLFTSLYPTAPLSAPGWQREPYPGIGYNMQFPTRVVYTAPTYTQTSKFVNPFDLTSDPDPTV